MPKKTNAQQSRRSYMQVKDPHGRVWGVTVETRDGEFHQVSPFDPVGWAAPWYPPNQYMALQVENFQPRAVIDYTRLIADRKVAEREYRRSARRVGQKLHGQAFRAEMERTPTAQMLEVIGSPPHPWQLADAARRGDRWILGLTDTPNEKLARFLPSPDRDPDALSDEDLLLEDEVEQERPKAERKKLTPAGV